MRLEIDIAEHHYNNIMALDSVSLGRVPYKGIIMYSINAIKHGKVLDQEPTTKNEAKYCDRNICLKNEYNNVGCEDCEVTKSQEPTTENNLGVDCISRAGVNQVIEDYMDEQYHVLSDRTRERAFGAKVVMARINELPSVTAQEPLKPMAEIDLDYVIKQKYIEREVLNKIRAEIEPTRKMYLEMNDIDWLNGCDYVLSVIDKYKAESEE